MFSTSHIHPMVVHFPIALILTGFVFDVVYLFFKREQCLSKAGLYLMILGTLGAGLAFASGHLFTDELNEGEVARVFNLHENWALITVIVMTLCSIVRIYLMRAGKGQTTLKWVSFGLYLAGAIAVSLTGFMGGNMVYKYIMGI